MIKALATLLMMVLNVLGNVGIKLTPIESIKAETILAMN